MTAARSHLSLVHSSAEIIPLPRLPRIEHNALRHAVLRQAADGILTRDDADVSINGHPVHPATRTAIQDLVDAGCIDWFTFGPAADGTAQTGIGQVGWITETGARQLAEWDGPRLDGDAA